MAMYVFYVLLDITFIKMCVMLNVLLQLIQVLLLECAFHVILTVYNVLTSKTVQNATHLITCSTTLVLLHVLTTLIQL